MKIHERSKIIIKILLNNNSYVTANEIATNLKVSIKTITRQLTDVEKILTQYNLSLERKTGKGMRIIGCNQAKTNLLQQIDENTHHEYSPTERQNIILSQLLKSQEPLKLIALSKLLNVTDTTIGNDLDKLEAWIKKMNLNLVRKPGLGIYLEGLEKDFRKAIINHIYTHIHEKNFLQLLYHQNDNSIKLLSDADKFLLNLVDKNLIQKVEETITFVTKEMNYALSSNAFSGLVVHLTLAIQRLLKGESIIIDNNFLAKIKLKPEFTIAKEIASKIEQSFQIIIPNEEIAYITMHLLGARNNYQQALKLEYSNFELIKIAKQIIDIAEQESGLSVIKKNKVLVGLVKHLAPAATRIKLKMEIRNPLLTEMKTQYPHWMDLAKKSVKPLEYFLYTDLPEAEIAYIAMHLGAAMEESKQKQDNFNILVACPTGIGTSKLLASQIKKCFSDLNIIATVSAINIDYNFCKQENVSFIISTVPIDEANLPVVVVDFMLQEQDKNNIISQINQSRLINNIQKNKLQSTSLTDKLFCINQYSKYICEILNGFFCIKLDNLKDINKLCDEISQKIFSAKKADLLANDLKQRESKGSTVFNNLMLLHTKTETVTQLTVGIGQLSIPIKFTDEENISIILILLAPSNADEKALETIGYISESLVDNLNLFDILYEGSQSEIHAELEKIYMNYFKEKLKKIMEV